jgi:hypothetical protein
MGRRVLEVHCSRILLFMGKSPLCMYLCDAHAPDAQIHVSLQSLWVWRVACGGHGTC